MAQSSRTRAWEEPLTSAHHSMQHIHSSPRDELSPPQTLSPATDVDKPPPMPGSRVGPPTKWFADLKLPELDMQSSAKRKRVEPMSALDRRHNSPISLEHEHYPRCCSPTCGGPYCARLRQVTHYLQSEVSAHEILVHGSASEPQSPPHVQQSRMAGVPLLELLEKQVHRLQQSNLALRQLLDFKNATAHADQARSTTSASRCSSTRARRNRARSPARRRPRHASCSRRRRPRSRRSPSRAPSQPARRTRRRRRRPTRTTCSASWRPRRRRTRRCSTSTRRPARGSIARARAQQAGAGGSRRPGPRRAGLAGGSGSGWSGRRGRARARRGAAAGRRAGRERGGARRGRQRSTCASCRTRGRIEAGEEKRAWEEGEGEVGEEGGGVGGGQG